MASKTDRRLGRFSIRQSFALGTRDETEAGVALMTGMFVVQAQHNFERDTIDYIGIHPQFDEVPLGETIPEYTAVFDDGASIPRWVKKGN